MRARWLAPGWVTTSSLAKFSFCFLCDLWKISFHGIKIFSDIAKGSRIGWVQSPRHLQVSVWGCLLDTSAEEQAARKMGWCSFHACPCFCLQSRYRHLLESAYCGSAFGWDFIIFWRCWRYCTSCPCRKFPLVGRCSDGVRSCCKCGSCEQTGPPVRGWWSGKCAGRRRAGLASPQSFLAADARTNPGLWVP